MFVCVWNAIICEILKSTQELLPANSATPFSNSENLHLMVGRVIKINREGSMRFLIQGGPGLYTSRNPVYEINSNSYDFDVEPAKSLLKLTKKTMTCNENVLPILMRKKCKRKNCFNNFLSLHGKEMPSLSHLWHSWQYNSLMAISSFTMFFCI